MRIVDQARLWFKEGNSDKVYEVDLVEVAEAQYVVNFRYGRRGSALRDGTKTPLPTSLEQARAVFTALVAEKQKGGYRPMEGAAPTAPAPPAPPRRSAGGDPTARRRAFVLGALTQGHRAEEPLHLVVRKATDLGLREAEPMLLELLRSSPPPAGMKKEIWRLLLVAALTRCGTSSAVGPLTAVVEDGKAPAYLKEVAYLGLATIDPARAAERALALYAPALPAGLGDDAQALVRTLERLLVDDPKKARAAIFGLYLASATSAVARTAVLGLSRVARLTGAEMGLLRSLYRASELRRDGELLAILARRFETLRSEPPLDTPTLRYFRRRVARFLRRLGGLSSLDYPRVAADLLVTYRDADAEPVRDTVYGTWPAFARYHALFYVLYGNSRRYARASHHRATWRVRPGTLSSTGAPAAREEAFAELWDRAPEELWRVGRSPAASIVIEFAAKALRAQTAFLAQLSAAELSAAMATAHPLIRRVAFDAARTRPLDVVLARGALSSGIDEADDWVLAWVKGDPGAAVASGELLALLATALSAKVRDELVALVRAHPIAPAVARAAVAQAIAILLGFSDDEAAGERAGGAAAALLRAMPEALDGIDLQVARDLLAHPLEKVAELGGEIVLRRARAGVLPPGVLDALLGSRHAAVRAIGARIVGDTPPEVLKGEPDLLVLFALSGNAELREGTRKVLGEVARRYPEVGRVVAERLLEALLVKQEEGVPAHVVSLLRHELAACLPRRDAKSILKLTSALSPHAREAGGLLLPQLGVDDLGLDDIIRLANNEILAIRRGAWALAEAAEARWKLAPAALGRLCDARWEDTRAFAFAFAQKLPLSPDAIIAICDSTQPAVEAFGQRLLLERWTDDNAAHYLLRLSEHPSTNVQLLVSGLLDRHGRGKLDLLRQLLPYLLTVLSQVNRGGVAKQRVLDFLRKEAVASPEAAALLGPVLDRQSLTRAVTHKGPLIASMVALRDQHPEVPLPITVVTPPTHARSARGV